MESLAEFFPPRPTYREAAGPSDSGGLTAQALPGGPPRSVIMEDGGRPLKETGEVDHDVSTVREEKGLESSLTQISPDVQSESEVCSEAES